MLNSQLQPIIDGSQGRNLKVGLLAILYSITPNQGTHLMASNTAGTSEDTACSPAHNLAYIQLAFLYNQVNGSTHSGLGPPASMNKLKINQDSSPQAYRIRAIFLLRLSPQMTLGFVNLIVNPTKTTSTM